MVRVPSTIAINGKQLIELCYAERTIYENQPFEKHVRINLLHLIFNICCVAFFSGIWFKLKCGYKTYEYVQCCSLYNQSIFAAPIHF